MSEPLNIYSRRKGAVPPPPDAVYVGRGTEWGNPYVMGRDGDRATVCQMFAVYAQKRLAQDPGWLDPLRGKHLVCWPKATPESRLRCHAETLLRLANQEEKS